MEKKNILSFNLEKSKKIIIESVEQSGFAYLPNISNPENITALINKLIRNDQKEHIYILDIENENTKTQETDLRDRLINKKEIENKYLFIGPEGGWTDKERDFFKKNNLNIKSFGKNILRAETAAIVGSFYFLNR